MSLLWNVADTFLASLNRNWEQFVLSHRVTTVASLGFLYGRDVRAAIWTDRGSRIEKTSFIPIKKCRAPCLPLLSAASAGRDCVEISYRLCCGDGWGWHRNSRNASRGPHVQRQFIGAGGLTGQAHWCTRGPLNRGSCLPSLHPARGGVPCPRSQRATETRDRWLAVAHGSKAVLSSVSSDLFLCCFQLIVCRCFWKQPARSTPRLLMSASECLPPSAFLLLPLPFLLTSVAPQICEKRLAFYRHRLPSTVLLSVFVG